ncbi:hypothetical protein BJ742DRAFT_309202 [Cladochytrium replicatum]|nr:hypothetical protein BJ742DRAFT_309202 [Cladochytrium replicatum]
MTGLQYGIQASDIRMLMEPMTSDCELKIDVLGAEAASMVGVVRVSPKYATGTANEAVDAAAELALLAHLDTVRSKFIRYRGYVRTVELCFVKEVSAEKEEAFEVNPDAQSAPVIEVVYTVAMARTKAAANGAESPVAGGHGRLGSGVNRFGILDADNSTKSAKQTVASKSDADALEAKEVKKLSEVQPEMDEWDRRDAVHIGEDEATE